jgi:hypothetical protein
MELNLFCSYQEAIEDITKRMGAGMAKFILKEVGDVGCCNAGLKDDAWIINLRKKDFSWFHC